MDLLETWLFNISDRTDGKTEENPKNCEEMISESSETCPVVNGGEVLKNWVLVSGTSPIYQNLHIFASRNVHWRSRGPVFSRRISVDNEPDYYSG